VTRRQPVTPPTVGPVGGSGQARARGWELPAEREARYRREDEERQARYARRAQEDAKANRDLTIYGLKLLVAGWLGMALLFGGWVLCMIRWGGATW
jgi:hypothetical protein